MVWNQFQFHKPSHLTRGKGIYWHFFQLTEKLLNWLIFSTKSSSFSNARLFAMLFFRFSSVCWKKASWKISYAEKNHKRSQMHREMYVKFTCTHICSERNRWEHFSFKYSSTGSTEVLRHPLAAVRMQRLKNFSTTASLLSEKNSIHSNLFFHSLALWNFPLAPPSWI